MDPRAIGTSPAQHFDDIFKDNKLSATNHRVMISCLFYFVYKGLDITCADVVAGECVGGKPGDTHFIFNTTKEIAETIVKKMNKLFATYVKSTDPCVRFLDFQAATIRQGVEVKDVCSLAINNEALYHDVFHVFMSGVLSVMKRDNLAYLVSLQKISYPLPVNHYLSGNKLNEIAANYQSKTQGPLPPLEQAEIKLASKLIKFSALLTSPDQDRAALQAASTEVRQKIALLESVQDDFTNASFKDYDKRAIKDIQKKHGFRK